MIRLDGATVVLKCDCHRGNEVTMAKISNGTLTIIANRYGDSHNVSVPLDKLEALCLQLVPVGRETSNPLVS